MRRHPLTLRNTYEGDGLDFLCTRCGRGPGDQIHDPAYKPVLISVALMVLLIVLVMVL